MVVFGPARWCLLISLLLLSGCFGGGHYAPVIERKQRLEGVPKYHLVNRGDTLYSIAWLYNIDFRGLAFTNSIVNPYTIYPGQKIHLHKRPASTGSNLPDRSKSQVPAVIGKSTPSVASPSRQTAAVSTSKPVAKAAAGYPFRWQWPARQKIIRRYSSASSVHKGIDIQGNFGEPVHAANSGKVVYAGSGLVGFGNLLIIKHNERYLSAYGHNSKLVVAEGAQVKTGQKIAEFGDSGTDTVKLHFEIRRDGKPVNPLSLLPKK
jgi:lipoprotein NlpD